MLTNVIKIESKLEKHGFMLVSNDARTNDFGHIIIDSATYSDNDGNMIIVNYYNNTIDVVGCVAPVLVRHLSQLLETRHLRGYEVKHLDSVKGYALWHRSYYIALNNLNEEYHLGGIMQLLDDCDEFDSVYLVERYSDVPTKYLPIVVVNDLIDLDDAIGNGNNWSWAPISIWQEYMNALYSIYNSMRQLDIMYDIDFTRGLSL